MDDRQPTPNWGDLALTVARLLGLYTGRSPTLNIVIERGVRFLTVDTQNRRIIFDDRALFIGFLAAGQRDSNIIQYGNTALFVAEWLAHRVNPSIIEATLTTGMTPPEIIMEALREKCPVELSASVKNATATATDLAVKTIRKKEFEARHLFFATVQTGAFASQAETLLKLPLGPTDIEQLRRALVDRLMETPEIGEDKAAWLSELQLSPEAEPKPSPSPNMPAVDSVTGFSPDSIASADSPDVLGTVSDARALARLMCLEGASPLAIAVFGGWGAGKSTFMERLDREVREVVRQASRIGDPGDRQARFVERIVQIRFNAWQFVDANLWASLTSEFFEQLRAGGWDRQTDASYASLVERVTRHVHALNADLESKRKIAIDSATKAVKARMSHDQAVNEAKDVGNEVLEQSSLDALREIYDSHRSSLSQLGLAIAGDDTSASVDAVVGAIRASDSIFKQLKITLWLFTRNPRLWLFLATGLLIGLIFAGIAWSIGGLRWVPGVFWLVGFLATIAVKARPMFQFVDSVSRTGAGIATKVREADQTATAKLLQSEIKLREAVSEAQTLEAAAADASHRLARYVDPVSPGNVDPLSPSNPPQLLRYVLEDDPDTLAFQSQLGLIGRTRRLFQAVEAIARKERQKLPSARDKDVPDRVIIYIDDLDRCSEDQVYNVLQAIHLLLAFELFVVVVGVDVARVQNALAKFIASLDQENTKAGESRKQLASQYLEKIFQIAFWLSPLTTTGSDGGSYARYLRSLATAPLAESVKGVPPPVQIAPGNGPVPAAGPPPEAPPVGDTAKLVEGPAVNGGNQGIVTITLEQNEIDFLASAAIGCLTGNTPRSVKRLVNCYRLVRTRLTESGMAILGVGSTPPAYPLIALMVALETGQYGEAADVFYKGLTRSDPAQSLTQVANALNTPEDTPEPTKSLAIAFSTCPPLIKAMVEAIKMRGGSLTIGELQPIAAITRRFSFNSPS